MELGIAIIGKSPAIRRMAEEIANGVKEAGRELKKMQLNEALNFPLSFIGISMTSLLLERKNLRELSQLPEKARIAVFTSSTAWETKPYFEDYCKRRFKRQEVLETLFAKKQLVIQDNMIIRKLLEGEVSRARAFGEKLARKVLNNLPSKSNAKQWIPNYKKE